ncbi:MAG: hypothetical protein HOO96_41540 [Polyangiaceae bacterium]|nr:hypothetical protein [Polyangiaceae bacterium]
MSTVYFASPVALLLSTLALASLNGCAIADADATRDDEAPTSEQGVGSVGEALVVQAPVTNPVKGLPVVAPACRAVLVATLPAVDNRPNTWGCAPANPYVGQRRYTGDPESGMTKLLDQTRAGKLTCTRDPSVPFGPVTCTRSADQLSETLCDATLVYDCPCGIDTVLVDGDVASACRTMPR